MRKNRKWLGIAVVAAGVLVAAAMALPQPAVFVSQLKEGAETSSTSGTLLFTGDVLLASSVRTVTLADTETALISYNEFFGQSAEIAVDRIRTTRQRGALPIVYAHWGAEYEAAPPAHVRRIAHAFADAGAALVIGTHSHVVGEHETYNGADTYYSLGNFVFDQYFSEAVRSVMLCAHASSNTWHTRL